MNGRNSPHEAKLEVVHDAAALAARVAAWIFELALATQGRFAICLAGGSTPRALYEILAGAPYLQHFPWQRTHLFWGDERFVPPDDKQSNYRMVREALLRAVDIPSGNIHAVPTQPNTPDETCAEYQRTLQDYYGASSLDPKRPMFDVTLLGLGPDGHTASLFPGTAALNERAAWVTTSLGPQASPRITLTYPTLESSRHVAFLVEGHGKQDILARVRAGDAALPASHVRPVGELHIFADTAAGPPVM